MGWKEADLKRLGSCLQMYQSKKMNERSGLAWSWKKKQRRAGIRKRAAAEGCALRVLHTMWKSTNAGKKNGWGPLTWESGLNGSGSRLRQGVDREASRRLAGGQRRWLDRNSGMLWREQPMARAATVSGRCPASWCGAMQGFNQPVCQRPYWTDTSDMVRVSWRPAGLLQQVARQGCK